MSQPVRRRGRPKGMKPPQSPSTIQALDRALRVLEALAAREGVTLTELAAHLAESPATMHRVLATLENRGYVESNPESQSWFVGPEAFRLGSAFLRRTNVVERSRPVMRDLMSDTRETSNLGIESDGHVVFVSQIETHQSIRAFFPPGTRSPLHASGIGKALLSTYDNSRLEAFIETTIFTHFTSKTIHTPDQLREAMALTRQRGYALDDEERTIGMRCVAAPIRNVYGEAIAGISISGPAIRMTAEKLAEYGERVVEAAREVSRRIGA